MTCTKCTKLSIKEGYDDCATVVTLIAVNKPMLCPSKKMSQEKNRQKNISNRHYYYYSSKNDASRGVRTREAGTGEFSAAITAARELIKNLRIRSYRG